MISEPIPIVRMLTGEVVKKCGFEFGAYELFYEYEGREYPITKSANSDDNTVEIPGPKCQWRSDRDNLIVRRKCVIKKPYQLYDLNYGVTREGNALGLAVIIKSVTSSQKIVKRYEESIIDTDQSLELTFDYTFAQKTYLGSIEFETILYLKEKGTVGDNPLFVNESGGIIGYPCPHNFILVTDGKTDEFKTYDRPMGNKVGLWKLNINWRDPLSDSFNNSIYLTLNTDHPDYYKTDIHRGDCDLSLICEIYSSAFTQIIWKLKYDEDKIVWDSILKADADAIKQGSVADYICYIVKERLESNCNDILSLSEKIRNIIYGGL